MYLIIKYNYTSYAISSIFIKYITGVNGGILACAAWPQPPAAPRPGVGQDAGGKRGWVWNSLSVILTWYFLSPWAGPLSVSIG